MNLAKGIRQTGIVHHRDISHTTGLKLEETYKGNPEFERFTSQMSEAHLRYQLSETAYLLPPKQREVARFMNLFDWVEWAGNMLRAYPTLTKEQQNAFAFVKEHSPLIEELTMVMECVRRIGQRCKRDGISKETAKQCLWEVSKLITCEGRNSRTIAVGAKIGLA